MSKKSKFKNRINTAPRRRDGEPTGAAGSEAPSVETGEPEPIGAPRGFGDDERAFSIFARVTAPKELDDPAKRRQWGLPPLDEPDKPGLYVVELNAQHAGGLSGANNAFHDLYRSTMGEILQSDVPPVSPNPVRQPVRIGKSYLRCELTDPEWRLLVARDEARTATARAIYRLWPDFPVRARTDRSIMTVKADAAMRSFDAAGDDITWAVVDSGIQADHVHFGDSTILAASRHSLLNESVRDLHRCFADIHEDRNGQAVNMGPLRSPDIDPNMPREEREALVGKHRIEALKDRYGHGTHVAGIIAGQAPGPDESAVTVLEHCYKTSPDGKKIKATLSERLLRANVRPRGVAPLCRLISLRVLDQEGQGRSSQVIQALEYVRESINDNPKMMRVHGVNLSVGYEFDAEMFACGQSPLCTTVDRLVQEGVVVVVAAGNTGHGSVAASVRRTQVGLSNTINDPGNAELAITVGSTHRDAPHTYGVSYFSSKGPTADGRLKPDLVAPGERITSCAVGDKLKDSGASADSKNCYVDDTGTSMAAPHVSGAVAAFMSIRREFIGRPREIKQIFLKTATSLGRERYFEGHGMVDLMRAIQSV